MTPECRVRVARALGRDLHPAEMAEMDRRIDRSARYLSRNDPDWETYKKRERLQRAGDHAGELVRAESNDLVRQFDLDYRLRQAGRDVLGDDFDALEKSGRLSFMDRASDLPQYRDGAHDDAVAVTLDDGRAVLFRDRMHPDAMHEILLHEVGWHAGMEGYLGPQGWKALQDDALKALDAQQPEALAAAQRVAPGTPDKHYAEELLAHWVQFAPAKDPFVSAMLGKMRAWVYRHIPWARGKVKLTNPMLRELATGSLNRAGQAARKLSRMEDGALRYGPMEGEGRFAKSTSRVLPFEQFEAEMRGIRKDWAPDEIARAYDLHKLYAGMQAPSAAPAGAVVPGQQERAPAAPQAPDVGLRTQGEAALEARGGAGGNMIADSDALDAALRADIEASGVDLEALELIHPETGERVPAQRLLDEIDTDRKAVDRLRNCAYPGGAK
ncbi:hypothetical protein [Hyphomonas sp.]|jgi:hypothetical protein|uniref:hypothetical protein n=1 Tax=Hyphomonas sp. TaxID=87 RepID=UPI0032EB6249